MMNLFQKHIFVVEDDPNNRAVFQIALRRDGAVVSFERWGPNALERLIFTRNVDLIILDLMLAQGANGFDIFTQIRENERFVNTPVVAVSAMDPAATIPKARRQGFSGFIAKPIEPGLFSKQIADVLSGEQIWYSGERLRI